MFRAALFLLLCLATPSRADDAYEDLMRALAAAETRAEAEALSGQIWEHWLTAPDAAAQEVLDTALTHRSAYDFAAALRHLDRLIEHWPDYAEGWNQRATLYFMLGDFDRSLADVEEVLAREPRHFGALSGKAVILFRQGRLGLAQITVREALKFHPFLNERFILEAVPATDL